MIGTSVFATIGPLEAATTMLLALGKCTVEYSAICVFEGALSMHSALLPVTGVDATLECPGIYAEALELTVNDGALIRRPIWPAKEPFSSFLTSNIVTHVLGAVWPAFFALAILLIVAPVTMIFHTFNARENAIAVVSPIDPVTLIDASICIDHTSSTVCLIIAPEAFEGALV